MRDDSLSMLPEQVSTIAWMRLIELLRQRQLPGFDRREAQRQADFEARCCDTDSKDRSSKEAAAQEEEEEESEEEV